MVQPGNQIAPHEKVPKALPQGVEEDWVSETSGAPGSRLLAFGVLSFGLVLMSFQRRTV